MDVVMSGPGDESLLLDLLNTTPVVDGDHTDALADLDAAAPWLTAHDLAVDRQEWATLVAVRDVVQQIVWGELSPTALGPVLAGAHVVPTATAHGVSWRLDEPGGAVRAALAWDRLRIVSPGRLRPCANTECRLFLIDRSKPNNARWCSMAVCGNRLKARRHYRRTTSS